MRRVALSDLEIYDFGNSIQFIGCILEGNGRLFLAPFPDQDEEPVTMLDGELLALAPDEWAKVFAQSDSGDVKTPAGIILRKGQRQIESNISWRVYERDDFRCRYCGVRKPLTVDHVDLWENGGASVAENLVTSCRHCNKLRGNREYDEWLGSADYKRRCSRLSTATQAANAAVIDTIPHLRTLRVPGGARTR